MRLERASILENLEQDSGQRTVSPLRIVAGMGGGSAGAGETSGPCTQLVLVWPRAPALRWPWHPGQVTQSALDFGFAICEMGLLPTSQGCSDASVDGGIEPGRLARSRYPTHSLSSRAVVYLDLKSDFGKP